MTPEQSRKQDEAILALLAKFDQHQANSRKWLADRGVQV